MYHTQFHLKWNIIVLISTKKSKSELQKKKKKKWNHKQFKVKKIVNFQTKIDEYMRKNFKSLKHEFNMLIIAQELMVFKWRTITIIKFTCSTWINTKIIQWKTFNIWNFYDLDIFKLVSDAAFDIKLFNDMDCHKMLMSSLESSSL